MLALAALPLAAAALAADVHVLGAHHPLAEGVTAWTAADLAELRAAPSARAAVVHRYPPGARAQVREDAGEWVRVRVGADEGWVAREELTTMGRVTDLDADGVEERIVVTLDSEGQAHVWLREGDAVRSVALDVPPEAWLGEWEVVPAEVAGVPLLRVHFDAGGTGEYPTTWLSWSDGVLRRALTVEPRPDGPIDVRFSAPGVATLVEERVDAEGEVVRTTERACPLTQGVFVCG